MDRPDLRASDADRERVVRCLERHTSAGRLSLDEHADRVTRTLLARTHGELATILADLPAEPDAAAPTSPATAPQLAVAFLVAGVALVLLTALLLLR